MARALAMALKELEVFQKWVWSMRGWLGHDDSVTGVSLSAGYSRIQG